MISDHEGRRVIPTELAAFLDMVDDAREGGRRALHEMSVNDAREAFESASVTLNAGAPAMPCEALSIATRDGKSIPARLYLPGNANGALLVYFHGGGYTVGSLDSHDVLCRTLAQQSACALLAVGYRLAPEAPFPTALEDGEDAWHWLLERSKDFGINPARIALAGDSAGATIATVLAARLGSALRAQLLFYPATDATQQSESHRLFADGYLLEAATLEWFYRQYTADLQDPRVSPLFAPRLAGSAPALVLVAQFDPLVDEGLAYARKLEADGVQVEAQLCEGMPHDFLRMGAVVPEVEEYWRAVAGFTQRYMS